MNSHNSINSKRISEMECKICYTPININEEDFCKLACGHEFHYECIFLTYKNNLNKKKPIRICPYCRKDGGYLDHKDKLLPVKGIHRDYNLFIDYLKNGERDKYIQFLNKDKCLAFLKTGPNKGMQCSFKACQGDFCKRHKTIL